MLMIRYGCLSRAGFSDFEHEFLAHELVINISLRYYTPDRDLYIMNRWTGLSVDSWLSMASKIARGKLYSGHLTRVVIHCDSCRKAI